MALEPNIPYVLAVDVGNTHITMGAVRGDQVYLTQKVSVAEPQRWAEALNELWDATEAPRRVVASSVNPQALEKFEAAIADVLDQTVAVIGRDLPLPLETTLKEPTRVGVDRLCCALGAYQRLHQACVIADFGTAITIDCVNAEGQFVGGAILPGMKMQASALHNGTAQLPEVELENPDWVFGRNTQEAIVGGIVFGVRGAMRAIVESYASELGTWPVVITTGGDAELVGRDDGIVQAIVPDLCVLGVALTYYKSLPPVDNVQLASEAEMDGDEDDAFDADEDANEDAPFDADEDANEDE